MRKTRKFIAAILFVSLAIMQVIPAFAEDLGTVGGTADADSTIEAYVDKNIYNIVLPTVSSIDFTLDPQGLLHISNATAFTTESGAVYFAEPVATTYKSSERTIVPDGTVTGVELVAETTYYLKNTSDDTYIDYETLDLLSGLPETGEGSNYENTAGAYVLYEVDVAAHNIYSDTSVPFEITNKSSLPVDLNFTVATTITDIDLVASADLATAENPSLALQVIATSSDTTTNTDDVLDSSYAATTQILADADSQYAIDSQEGAYPDGTPSVVGATSGLFYAYILDDTFTDFSSMSYEISGECNNVEGWESVLGSGTVSLAITWQILEHSSNTAPTITGVTNLEYDSDTDTGAYEIATYTDGAGTLAVTENPIAVYAGTDDTGTLLELITDYTIAGNSISLTEAYLDALSNGTYSFYIKTGAVNTTVSLDATVAVVVLDPAATVSESGLLTISNLTASANLPATVGATTGFYDSIKISSTAHPVVESLNNEEITWDTTNWTSENGGTITLQLSEVYLTYYKGSVSTYTITLSNDAVLTATTTLVQ